MTKSLNNNDFLKGFSCFSCFQHFWKVKVSENRETPKSLEYGKRPEIGKRQNPLNTESVQKQGNNKIPWIRKVSGNRKTTKSFESAKTSLTRGAERPFRCLDLSKFVPNVYVKIAKCVCPNCKMYLFQFCKMIFIWILKCIFHVLKCICWNW